MFPGPVFYSELRKLSRQRRFYALRFGFGLLMLYFVVQAYSSLRWRLSSPDVASGRALELTVSETALLGASLYSTVFWLQSIAVLFLTPALLAGSVAEDRQRRVLVYLLASPLNSAEIVLGKVAARLFNVVVIVASCFPIVSLALLFGGIDPMELMLTYACTFTTIFFLAGVSIAVSTFTARPREAILRAYFWELFWLAWPLLDYMFRHVPAPYNNVYQTLAPVLDWFTASSPSSLIEFNPFAGGSYLEKALWMMGLQVLYGSIFLIWATLRLRPIERGSRLFFRRGSDAPAPVARRLWNRRPCTDRPMIWKECSGAVVSRNLVSTIVTGVFLLAAIGGLGYLAYYVGAPAFIELLNNGYGGYPYEAREDLNAAVRVLTAVVYVLMLFMLAGVAATSFTSEREKDTWVSLIASPLEAEEIIAGKFLGALWRVRFVLGLLLLTWVFGLVLGAVHPLAFVLIVVLTLIDAMFVAAVGCHVSLRMTSSARAIAVTIGILLVAKGGYMFCCIPILRNGSSDSSLIMIGLTPTLVTFATATYNEVHSFLFTDLHNRYSVDWTATVVVCLMVHSFVIVMLGLESTSRFLIVADRPNRSTELVPTSPGKLDDQSKPDPNGEPPPWTPEV